MNYYQLPASLGQDIEKLASQIAEFKAGTLAPPKFKAVRVAYGIYEQRVEGQFMMRLRCPQGAITPNQLAALAQVSAKYGSNKMHATTRQGFQLYDVSLDNLIPAYKELAAVGLSGRCGGGNTVRSMVAPFDTGISLDEEFDVSPYLFALTTRMLDEGDSYNLPRKLKIGFSSNARDNGKATLTCLGFLAQVKDGRKGFKVYVGGGTGSSVKYGKLLLDWIPDHRVYYVAKAVKRLFDEQGNRKQRNRAKIKWLVERLGIEEFQKEFYRYYALLQQETGLELLLPDVVNASQVDAGLKPVVVQDQAAFAVWKARYVKPQGQAGLFQVRIGLHLGALENQKALALAQALAPFGPNCLRLSPDQNLNLRNIPESHLGNVFHIVQQLDQAYSYAAIFNNVIACTGAQACSLGLTQARPLAGEIQQELTSRGLNLDAYAAVTLQISGCPNACGNNHVADIGLFGKALKQAQHLYPAYVIQLGGRLGDGTTETAAQVAQIAAKQAPRLIADLFQHHSQQAAQLGDFKDYVRTEEAFLFVKDRAQAYEAAIPSLEEDESFYVDWGEVNRFSLLKGKKAECSAGLFDMIDYDFTQIKEIRKALLSGERQAEDAAYDLVLHASRSLLVTRGIEADTDAAVFAAFTQDFINVGLVPERFSGLVQLASKGLKSALAKGWDQALELCDHMKHLYETMDDALRFHLDQGKDLSVQTPAPAAPVKPEPKLVKKDFRGVACPMNFVKTKIALDPLHAGELLEILLDDGQPIANVPGSVELEGHEILSQEQAAEGHWTVLIKKV